MLDVIEKPKVDLTNMFVPVIFANGEDNDTPGLVAAIENRSVQFDNKIYLPDENISITDKTIRMCEGIISNTGAMIGCSDQKFVTAIAPDGKLRHIFITNCNLKLY